jgi:hypothetical protein
MEDKKIRKINNYNNNMMMCRPLSVLWGVF